MSHAIIATKDHPLNLDRSARLMMENREGSVYQVGHEFVATLKPAGRCFDGVFTTVADAAAAIEEYAWRVAQ